MADELQKISNPSVLPETVLESYARQNTISEGIRNGLDCSAPVVASATTVTLPIGGPVDVNGVLFSMTSATTLTISLADTDYYIYLAAGSDSSHLTPTLTTDAGTFDATKNARYTSGGDRILNWVLRRDSSAAYVARMIDPQALTATEQGLKRTDSVVFDDLTVSSTLKLSTSPTEGSQTLTASSGVYLLPEGLYEICNDNFLSGFGNTVGLQVYAGGDWRVTVDSRYIDDPEPTVFCFAGGMIYSNGSNARFYNGYVQPITFRYLKY